jgi:uncharacterized delta-60 repeat protein
MRLRTASLLLLPVLLLLCFGAAGARAASPHGGLDRSFGDGGTAKATSAEAGTGIKGVQFAPGGRVYVLEGKVLFAFQSDGKVAGSFGTGGQVTVVPSPGQGGVSGLAVDSQGRPLVAGTTTGPGQEGTQAYVIRFLPDGSRDPSFGSEGEVDTDLGLPSVPGQPARVSAFSIVVDPRDRPIIGGSFEKEGEPCGYNLSRGSRAPYVARLTATGELDGSYAGEGRALFSSTGGVSWLAEIPGGGSAVFTTACSTPPRYEARGSAYSVLAEDGAADPAVTESGVGFSYLAPKIDSSDRIVELESPPPAGEGPDSLVRFLPNGDSDPSFGHKGRVVLRRGYRYADAFAVDSHGRPIIAVESGRIALMRFLPDGRVDKRFGHDGRISTKGEEPTEITLDSRGRIYALSAWSHSSKTTVAITRFLPGR